MGGRSSGSVGVIAAFAGFCAGRRWAAVGVWLVVVLGAAYYVSNAQPRYSIDLGVAGSDSQRATDLISQVVPGGVLPDTERIVVHASRGTLADPSARERAAALIAEVGTLPGVTAVADPFGPLGAAVLGAPPVSADGRTALIPVIMTGSALEPDLGAVERMMTAARAYGGPELQVELSGPGVTRIASGGQSLWPLLAAALAAFVVLCVTLRSRTAVMVCLVVAAGTTVLTLAAVSFLSHVLVMTSFAPLLAGVLGFGASLGGAVVVVHRAQTGLLRGRDPAAAATAATTHTGFAVAGGGLCVSLAMTGVVILRLGGFDGVAAAAAAAGAATCLVVLTFLPALLAVAGTRLLGWTERHHLTTTGAGLPRRPGLRSWWAGQVARRPVIAAAAAGLVLAVIAIPATSLRLGGGDAGADPTSATTRRAYDLTSRDFFPGLNGPMVVVVDRSTPGPSATVADIVTAIGRAPGVEKAFPVLENPERGLAMVQVLPRSGPRSPEASDLLRRLRNDVLPTALRGTVTKVYVGGPTALFDDMAGQFRSALPLFVGLVVLTAGLLALLTLRSVISAAVLAGSGLLSVLATAGAVATIFQTDRFALRLGLQTSPIEPFVVALVLVAVFGLAQGMNLSLLGRLEELEDDRDRADDRVDGDPDRDRDGEAEAASGRDAVRRGHAEVGHVVLTINLIVILVFLGVAAQPGRIMKVLGLGLAIGVAVDAFVLRAAVLPALLHLRRRGLLTAPRPYAAPSRVKRNRGRHSSRTTRSGGAYDRARPGSGHNAAATPALLYRQPRLPPHLDRPRSAAGQRPSHWAD